jgi:hypothetical protein
MADTTSLIQALRGSTAGAAAPMTFFQPNYGAGQGMLADYSKPAGNMAFNPVRLYTPKYTPPAATQTPGQQTAQRGGLLSPEMLSVGQVGDPDPNPHVVPDPNIGNALMALSPFGSLTTLADIFSPMFMSQDPSGVPVVDMSVSDAGMSMSESGDSSVADGGWA